MGVDRASLKMLRKQRLRFTVFDDGHDDDNEDGSGAIVGSAVVSLNKVAAGGEVTGEFELKDGRGRRTGDIEIIIRWENPNEFVSLVGTSAARETRDVNTCPIRSDKELRWILRNFSTSQNLRDDDEIVGNIDYLAFLRWAMPSKELAATQQTLRLCAVGTDSTDEGEEASRVLLRELESVDDDADGKVSGPQLESALSKLGWNLREDEIDILLVSAEDGGADGDIESIARLSRVPDDLERRLEMNVRSHIFGLVSAGTLSILILF